LKPTPEVKQGATALSGRKSVPVAPLATTLRYVSDIPCSKPANPLDILPMSCAPLPPPLRALIPGFASRFALILAGLCAVVARRFLQQPNLLALTIPLWTRLNRASRRFERLMAQLAAGRLPRHAASRRGECSRGASGAPAHRERTFHLPHGKGWLTRALGHEAAAYAAQLAHLLAEPGMAELLAAAPSAGRILRPLCRMLGLPDTPDTPLRGVARQATSDTPLRGVARQAAGVFPLKNPESVLAPSPPPLTLRPPPCPHLRFRWPWVPHPHAKLA
jgi:hypothetical protein